MRKNKGTKAIVLAIIISSLILLGAGCGASGYVDGTYEGSSNSGIHSGLKVTVVVKDTGITEVDIIEHSETEGVGTLAIDKLPALIVESQSTEVDSVSGATLTSTAIKEAVDQALSQAKK